MKYLWLLLLLALPFQLGRHFWLPFSYINGLRVDYLSPTIYFQDLIFLIILGLSVRKYKKHLVDKVKYVKKPLFIVLSLLIGISLYLSYSPWMTMYSYFRLGQLLVLVYLSQQEKTFIINTLKYVLPISAITQLSVSLGQIITGHSVGGLLYWLGERTFNLATPDIARTYLFGQVWLRPYGTFSHPNSLAGFMLLVFILALFLLSGKARKITLILSSLVVLLSYSQSAWLGLLFIGVYLFTSRFRFNLFVLVIITIAVIILSRFVFPQLTNQLITSSSFTLRLTLLKTSWLIFLSNPLFGVGLGNYIIALSQQGGYSRLVHWFQPVHNIFILWFVETGLIGIGILIYFIKKLFRIVYSAKDLLNNYRYNRHFIVTFMLVFFLTGMFDHYWLTLIQNRLLLAITLGIVFSRYDKKELKVVK